MADRIMLALEPRTVLGKKVKRLRREGILPATVYGKGFGPLAVQVDARTFTNVLRQAGRTTLIDLEIPDQPPQSAFIHALQRHPVSRAIIHADLHVVDLRIEITVAVPVHLIGESPLVERGDAVLNQSLMTLDVRALPTDIPHYVEVDISGLDSFDKNIYVRDIQVSKGAIVTAEDELVVNLTPARAEEEEVEEAPEEVSAEPELVREKREEEEEE